MRIIIFVLCLGLLAVSLHAAPYSTPTWAGTGFVVNANGYLVTCYHVVNGTALLRVFFGNVMYPASVVRTDEVNDLALIKIDATGLPTLPLADGTNVKKGQDLRVFGYPLASLVGTDLKVSGGMFSGTAKVNDQTYWQVDAALNGGNSGGPATDLTGAVLGVAAAKIKEAPGINFIVPVQQVKQLLDSAKVTYHVTDAGVVLQNTKLVKHVEPTVALIFGWQAFHPGLQGKVPGDMCINPKDMAEMVWVPAGDFLMGSSDDDNLAWWSEKPQHRVELDGYWIYKYEVTVGQWRRYIAALWKLDIKPSWKEFHPIIDVTWYDADAYSNWAGAGLPTEAEWEKAARSDDGRIFPWGNAWDASKAQCSKKEGDADGTAPVGSFPSGTSPYGCLDMAGNVYEWCADWFEETLGERGNDYYKNSPKKNPTGTTQGYLKVIRGGSWGDNDPHSFRTASRVYHHPSERQYYIGFRCVVHSPIP